MKMEMRLVIAEKTATMMVYKSFEQFKQFMDGSKGFVHYAGFLYPATPGFGEYHGHPWISISPAGQGVEVSGRTIFGELYNFRSPCWVIHKGASTVK